tara:strand:+ start:592 stop:1401 length:810 start_codon:yes stop_codon:yes gene_type:complete
LWTIFFLVSILTTVIILPAYGIDISELENVGLKTKYIIISNGQEFQIEAVSNFQIISHTFSETDKILTFNVQTARDTGNESEFYIPKEMLVEPLTVLLDGQKISAIINKADNIFYIGITVDGKGDHVIEISETKILEVSNDGGCLIATATFGSEMAPQVQSLREIRDNTVLQTGSGALFMTGFNQLYYSFSPVISDYERENPVFKEAVKLTLTPLLTSLTLLQYADIDSEYEMLGYGIGIIVLNSVMYFIAPAVLIIKLARRVNIVKLD